MAGRRRKEIDDKSPFAKRLDILLAGGKINQLAEKCDVKEGALHRILQGADPKADTVTAIVAGTGCSLEWFLTGEGEPFPPPELAENPDATFSKVSGLLFQLHASVTAHEDLHPAWNRSLQTFATRLEKCLRNIDRAPDMFCKHS